MADDETFYPRRPAPPDVHDEPPARREPPTSTDTPPPVETPTDQDTAGAAADSPANLPPPETLSSENADGTTSEPDDSTLRRQLEAILFVSATPIRIRALKKILGVDTTRVRRALSDLEEDCEGRGIEPVEVSGGYQLRTKSEHAPMLRDFLRAKPARLSRAALETLAIVAYRQPLTRAEAEDIRGVDCGAVLRGLLERRLVRIIGRKEEPGRPILYGTTPTFLELFGLQNLRELPTLREFVELSEEHQRLVDREAPDQDAAKQIELEGFLSDVGEYGEAGIDVETQEAELEANLAGVEPEELDEDGEAEAEGEGEAEGDEAPDAS